MQPHKDSNRMEMPITFDSNGMKKADGIGSKVLWSAITTAIWALIAMYLFFGVSGFTKFIMLAISVWVMLWIIRFIIIKEKYYMKRREELIEKNYAYEYKLFWNIIDIKNTYPYVAQFGDGRKGIFVFFDKDVIIGKGADDDYDHYETIAVAYSELAKRGIAWEHIDYMDVAGKDPRLKNLFKQVEGVNNPDLKDIMLSKYSYIENQMNNVYSTYDVYTFYSSSTDENFWYDLEEILAIMLEANYSTYRVLDKEGIGDLVRTLMNIDDFSVNKTMETLYSKQNNGKRLVPIWVEKDGVKDKLNDTKEERAEKIRVNQQERKVQKSNGIGGIMKRKDSEEDNKVIDLFGENEKVENQQYTETKQEGYVTEKENGTMYDGEEEIIILEDEDIDKG